MGERKVLNKYYPPDIDFWKPPKLELPRDRQYVVRLMIPFTMRCVTCGNHIYKGKKFNARKETVQNEKYLGMPIFRFYVRCPDCLSEITFKTDPESTDYVAEHGAYRTFQAENIAVKAAEDKLKEQEEEEANNPMLALENRTKESRREMDILDVLEEIRDVNAQHEGVTFEQLIDRHLERERTEIEEEEQIDEALAKAAFDRARNDLKRVKDDQNISDEDDTVVQKKPKTTPTTNPSSSSSKEERSNVTTKRRLVGLVKRKKERSSNEDNQTAVAITTPTQSQHHHHHCSNPSLGLLTMYSDDSSNSD